MRHTEPIVALEHVLRDVRYGVRALWRERVFTITSLATLALGCATTIAAFSVANAELWRPLPFPHPRQLADVDIDHGGLHDRWSTADLRAWNAQSRLARYTGWDSQQRTLHRDAAESVTSWEVTADFFSRLGVTPSIGFAFAESDDRGAPAAVLSEGAWRRLFDGDRSVVGRAVRLDDTTYTVVGVLAGTHLEFTNDPDFLLSAGNSSNPTARHLSVIARLEPGATLAQAEGELQAIVERLPDAAAQSERATVRLRDLQTYWTGHEWRQVYFFLGAAFLVLTLSCLNVSNLLVARALTRQREFAIRGALGGGTAVLVRQLAMEGALLALPGVAAGVSGALVLLRGFTAAVPAGLLERGGDVQLDVKAAVFAAALSVAVTLALAAAPLLSARRMALASLLGQRGTAGTPRQRGTRRALLVAQITATVVLTAAAGLLALSFLRLTQTPLGFSPEARLSLRMPVPGASRNDAQAVRRFAARMLEEATATPGVVEAAIGSAAPLDSRGGPGIKVFLPGETPSPGAGTTSLIFGADPSYFKVLGISLLDGRAFTALDAPGAPRVCIINERLARRLSPGTRAVGSIVNVVPRVRSGWTNYAGPLTVVGVAADVKNFAIDQVDYDNLYVPFAQAPSPTPELIVRTSVPPATVIPSLKAAMHRVDGSQPVLALAPLSVRADETTRGARFNLSVFAFFAGLAVAVAMVGIYGVMVCWTQERTREFGIRIALGAVPRAILAAALRESAAVTIAGCGIGLAVVLVLARVLGRALYLVPNQHLGVLYRVSMTNPAALAGACIVLLAVTLLATAIPARQASHTDPVVALRMD